MTPVPAMIADAVFPRTRYQGSKRKLAQAIVSHLKNYEFESALDAFGGTGAIAHALKADGKRVTYNDIMQFNYQVGVALIENDDVRINEEDLRFIQVRRRGQTYDDFIERTFGGIFFTEDENRWLDVVCQNIPALPCRFKQAQAWFCVFQAAMIKRPFNLFHRSNLYMRLANVSRSFGNKSSWEGAFADYVHQFAGEANGAVFSSGKACKALCADAVEVSGEFDLVYIDTPYIKRSGTGTDYWDFYHFLEGMVRYREWPELVDRGYRHLPLRSDSRPAWLDADRVAESFDRLFDRFRSSILCVSYRNDGAPAIAELCAILKRHKRTVTAVELRTYQYALSENRETKETLIIGN